MKKKQTEKFYSKSGFKAYCHFCGSTVGQISDITEVKVSAIYDCSKTCYMKEYIDRYIP